MQYIPIAFLICLFLDYKLKIGFFKYRRTTKLNITSVVASKRVTCALGCDGAPTTCEDGLILPRKAEMIINAKYYPSGKVGEWPIDPETGKELEMYRA